MLALIDLLLGSGKSGVGLSAGEAVFGLITDRGRVAFDLKLPLISEAMPNGEWRMACLYRNGFCPGCVTSEA